MTKLSDPELENPPHTPNWSTMRGGGQQMPPASSSPAQQVPFRSTARPLPPQLPHTSNPCSGGQHSPTLSKADPSGQHCADPPTTPVHETWMYC